MPEHRETPDAMKAGDGVAASGGEAGTDMKAIGAGRPKVLTRKRALLGLLIVGITVGAFFGIRWLHYYITHASTDDARIRGDLISVSPTVQGKILQLPIEEGETVSRGQLIAQLRPEDYQAQVDVAAGTVQAIEGELRKAEADFALVGERTEKEVSRAGASLAAAEARLGEAEARWRQASEDFQRVSKLYQDKTVSPSEMDRVRAAYELARAGVQVAKEEIKENQAKLQVARANTAEVSLKKEQIESLKGRLKEAQASLSAAQLKLDHTTVTSPIDGVVARKIAHISEVVKSGQTVAVLVDLNKVWVEANLEETKLQHVRLGQQVDLEVDAYPGTRFRGKVVTIGATAVSEFALIPENRSSGNFTKVTQRIPIKIEVLDPARPLRPGMMVTVGIDIRGAEAGSPERALAEVRK
jgi:membrane fusion protein (multidrug efflux system)